MAPYNNAPGTGTRNSRLSGRGSGAGALVGGALFVGVIAVCALVISYHGIFQFAEYGGHESSPLAHVFPATYTLLLLMAFWVSYMLREARPRDRLWVDLILIPALVLVAAAAMLLSNLRLIESVNQGVATVIVAVAPLAALLIAFLLWITVRAHIRRRRRVSPRPRPAEDRTTVLPAREDDSPDEAPVEAEASVPTVPLPRRSGRGDNPIKRAVETAPVVPGAARPTTPAESDDVPATPDHLSDEGFQHEPPPGDPTNDEAEAPPAAPEAPAPEPEPAPVLWARDDEDDGAEEPFTHAAMSQAPASEPVRPEDSYATDARSNSADADEAGDAHTRDEPTAPAFTTGHTAADTEPGGPEAPYRWAEHPAPASAAEPAFADTEPDADEPHAARERAASAIPMPSGRVTTPDDAEHSYDTDERAESTAPAPTAGNTAPDRPEEPHTTRERAASTTPDDAEGPYAPDERGESTAPAPPAGNTTPDRPDEPHTTGERAASTTPDDAGTPDARDERPASAAAREPAFADTDPDGPGEPHTTREHAASAIPLPSGRPTAPYDAEDPYAPEKHAAGNTAPDEPTVRFARDAGNDATAATDPVSPDDTPTESFSPVGPAPAADLWEPPQEDAGTAPLDDYVPPVWTPPGEDPDSLHMGRDPRADPMTALSDPQEPVPVLDHDTGPEVRAAFRIDTPPAPAPERPGPLPPIAPRSESRPVSEPRPDSGAQPNSGARPPRTPRSSVSVPPGAARPTPEPEPELEPDPEPEPQATRSAQEPETATEPPRPALRRRPPRTPVEKRPMVFKPPRPPMPDFSAEPPSRRVRSEPLRPEE